MRVLEVILILLSVVAAGALLFGKRNRRLDAVLLSLLALTAALHGLLDSFRLQMVPAYATVLTLAVILLRRMLAPAGRDGRKRSILVKGVLSVLTLSAAALSIYLSNLLPAFTMPEPTGKYAIGTAVRHLTDSSREETMSAEPGDKRELMVNVWYPVDPDSAKGKPKEHYPAELGEAISLVFGIPKEVFGYVSTIPTHVVRDAELSKAEDRYPVLLFSPGVRSTRFQSMTTIEELVSHGYIVVGIDHPFTSAKVSFPDGRDIFYRPEPEFPTSAALYENNVKGVGIRAADARFVLDTIAGWNERDPDGLLEGRVDMDRIGIFGHSYGGATTAEALAQDERFKAGVSLEGGFWGTVAHAELKQPFMYIMSGGTAKSFDPGATKKDKVFYDEFAGDLKSVMTKSLNDTYYLTVDGFFHQSFTEIALLSPPLFAKTIDPVHNIDITRSYVRAFFDRYFKGGEQPLLDGPSPDFPEVTFDPKYTKTKKQPDG